ncbi:MAG TPA: cytochrome c oxidase assembly protein [Bryobacteraceae bacterium]|nr:cytochrome c oxidase assembly protein [Bryobacteraceae bacterium]
MTSATLTLVIVLIGAVYLRGWRHRRSIAGWRAGSFILGLLATWVATASPVSSWDGHMLTAHMIQHVLLMTIAPPLFWLGEPLIAAHSARWPLPKGHVRLLGHPAFCWLAAAAALVVWHVPAIFRLGMYSSTWHFIEHTSFLTTGLLFWWPVIQPWPSVARWPRWSMLLYLFLATLPCDVLSGLLVFCDRVAYPMYLCTPQNTGFSPLEDQQCAAALMWTSVTVVFLVAGTILSMQMLSPKPRLQKAVSI